MTAPQDGTLQTDAETDLHNTIAALRAERDAALAREVALAEILGLINRSPGDPAPVFDKILDKAHELCGAVLGSLVLLNGEEASAVALHGYEPNLERLMRERRTAGTSIRELAGNVRCIHVPDIRALDPEVRGPVMRAHIEQTDARTRLTVPLRRDESLIGFITAMRREVRPFSESQIGLLESFAALAVMAIENARLIGELRQRTDELATRNTEFGERIEQQAATIDVLKAMSASPSDPQPVFEQIVRNARDLCECMAVGLLEYDGTLVHLRTSLGVEAHGPAAAEAYTNLFPMPPIRGSIVGRAILDRKTIHTRDILADGELDDRIRSLGHGSGLAVPFMRDGQAIGALTISLRESGGFSESQVTLLHTFAEQAVIAITSAETYRALQTRTSDLQQSLEYQTATSDVLKLISRSTFDLQPVLAMVAETAARLCVADQGAIMRREGDALRLVANFGFPAEYEAWWKEAALVPIEPYTPTVAIRAIYEHRAVHVHDATTVPGYPDIATELGKQRTSLGLPLLREGEPVGVIVLARQRVEPFTDRQIELVRTFADQAVIAIENTRLLTEQREALEQQTATAEVLQVINANPGNLEPVFDALLEKALRLCDAASGALWRYENPELIRVATRGLSSGLLAVWNG